jgi:hypothetical protein
MAILLSPSLRVPIGQSLDTDIMSRLTRCTDVTKLVRRHGEP